MLGSDVVWLRKLPRAGFINAGREVLGFTAAYGPYAAVHYFSGLPPLSLDFLPAAAILVCLYFFSTRSLFYFTLLVRDKLEYAEKILILRWEIISYLLTLIATVVGVAAVQALAPVGWVAVGLALGVLGLLTRKIIEEAIGAEDLNKVHLMETAIASNATLQGSFDQIERLAYRLLDWGDFRVYRVDGAELSLAYRGTHGRPDRGEPPAEMIELRREAIASGAAGHGPRREARRAHRPRDGRASAARWCIPSASATTSSAWSRWTTRSATPTARRTSWRSARSPTRWPRRSTSPSCAARCSARSVRSASRSPRSRG